MCRQNSMNILRQITAMAGHGCSIVIMTYSVTDGWLRQLLKLIGEFHVVKTVLVLDRDVMIRHREKLLQIERIATECHLTDSHAKLYYANGPDGAVAVITSANATNNYRNECYYATDRPDEIRTIESDIRTILANAVRIV